MEIYNNIIYLNHKYIITVEGIIKEIKNNHVTVIIKNYNDFIDRLEKISEKIYYYLSEDIQNQYTEICINNTSYSTFRILPNYIQNNNIQEKYINENGSFKIIIDAVVLLKDSIKPLMYVYDINSN